MRSRSQLARSLVAPVIAVAGLVGAHLIDYVLVLRDAGVRHDTLAETGHAYLSHAIVVGAASALLAALATAILGYRQGRAGEGMPLAFRPVAARLFLLQSVGFVLLEIGERLAAGAPVRGLAGEAILWVGLLLQALVACMGAAVLALIHRAAERVGTARARRAYPGPPVAIYFGPEEYFPPARLFGRPGPIRAPPGLLVPKP